MYRSLVGNLRGIAPLDCRTIHPHPASAEERLTRVELELAQARREKLRLRERLLELGVDLEDNEETAP